MQTSAAVIMLVLMVLLFGAVIKRLLGVRVGFVRTFAAGVIALLVAGPLAEALVPDPDNVGVGATVLYLALAVSFASVVAMTVLVIAEVLIPDGSLPGPIELWRNLGSRVARTRRYWQVIRIAMRHGLGRFMRGQRYSGLETSSARRDLAKSLRRALDEGGVTFVKLGQALSTRRDLVPDEFAEELALLQDQVSPLDWPTVRAVVESELERSVDDVFETIDPTPLAAASVAQAHAATLRNGAAVVVKVQRPQVSETVERDLDILARLASTAEERTSWGRSMGLRRLASGFAGALREELDFTIERDNLSSLAAGLEASRCRLSECRLLIRSSVPAECS